MDHIEDLTDIPVLGRFIAAGLLAFDLLLHSGTMLLDLVGGLVMLVIGQPDLLIGTLGTLYRLGDTFPVIPRQTLKIGITVLLVVLAAKYIGKLYNKVTSNS